MSTSSAPIQHLALGTAVSTSHGRRTILSPAQLERKRAHDRESQRANRKKMKDHIHQLEQEILRKRGNGDSSKVYEELLQRNQMLRAQLAELKECLSSSIPSSPSVSSQSSQMGMAEQLELGTAVINPATSSALATFYNDAGCIYDCSGSLTGPCPCSTLKWTPYNPFLDVTQSFSSSPGYVPGMSTSASAYPNPSTEALSSFDVNPYSFSRP